MVQLVQSQTNSIDEEELASTVRLMRLAVVPGGRPVEEQSGNEGRAQRVFVFFE